MMMTFDDASMSRQLSSSLSDPRREATVLFAKVSVTNVDTAVPGHKSIKLSFAFSLQLIRALALELTRACQPSTAD